MDAVILIVTKDTNSSFAQHGVNSSRVEPFLVTVGLQWALWSSQRLPRVTTQWGVAVLPVSDQWVQRASLLVDDNEFCLLADFHSQTDLGEGRFPVARSVVKQTQFPLQERCTHYDLRKKK